MKPYYLALGVEPSATQAEVRAAYMRLVQFYHPDKNRDNEKWAAAMFRQAKEAYDVLGDPAKRAAYDRPAARPVPVPLVQPLRFTIAEDQLRDAVLRLAAEAALRAQQKMQEPSFVDSLIDRVFGKKPKRKRGAA